MAHYIISYDLHKEKDYKKITDALEKGGAEKLLESLWIIKSEKTSEGLMSHFSQYVDADDNLLVIQADRSTLEIKKRKGISSLLGGY